MKGKERQKTAEFIGRNRQDMEGTEGSARSMAEKNIRNKNGDGKNDKWEINNPSTWTDSNIDQVAAAVKHNPSADYATAFWNTYAGPFGTIPANLPLRSLIIRAKRPHSAYARIPDEEYIGDVTALMWDRRLEDWKPGKESLGHYIGCRCRPNAEYGRSIIRAHGSRVYAFVKDSGDGFPDIRPLDSGGGCGGQGYVKKYVNLPVLSADAIISEDGGRPCSFLEYYSVPDNCPEKIEAESTRLWLMKTCNVTEYEMRICEAVAGYGKCLDAWLVEEINAKIVVPSGGAPMTQEELYKFNFRIHKRAKHHYKRAMSGLR